MKAPRWIVAGFASLLVSAASIQTAAAQLPFLDESPWLGYFGVFENNRFQFTFAAQGKVSIIPLDEKGKPVSGIMTIPLIYGIEEVLPDGRTQMKKIDPASLESTDKATDKFQKAVIRGKVTGDATFEATFEVDHGMISIGGHVTDPGKLTKNPLRFAVRVKLPNAYSKVKKEEKKDLKAFEKKIKSDRIDLKWTDGKRLKKSFDESVDVTTKEINGPGISNAEVEIGAYKDRKFDFTASENSSMRLWNDKPGPLHEGFWITWQADAVKDPQGKARFSIQVK